MAGNDEQQWQKAAYKTVPKQCTVRKGHFSSAAYSFFQAIAAAGVRTQGERALSARKHVVLFYINIDQSMFA